MGKVIIDGVNVSECDRLRTYRDWTYSSDKWCGISNDGGCECKQNPDCYYKQLQRAETEIEELKKQVKNNETAYHTELGTYNMECGNLLEENKELIENNLNLSKENEQLKANKGRCAFKCLDNTFCPEADKKITELELSRNSYKVNFETAKKYREKAEQALQEIRDMADNQKITAEYTINKIIDKINEVIGAEE